MVRIIFSIFLTGLLTACATSKPTVEQTGVSQAGLCSEVASAEEFRETLLAYRYDEGGKWTFSRGSRSWSGPVSLYFEERAGTLWAFYQGTNENQEWYPEGQYLVEFRSNEELSFSGGGSSSRIRVNLELQDNCMLKGTVRGDWGMSTLSFPPHEKNT